MQSTRPDKQLYRITIEGRAALDAWLETVEAGIRRAVLLEALRRRLDVARRADRAGRAVPLETEARLDELRAIEPTNTRTGNDFFHYFLLRLGIERAEQSLAWADWVVAELERAKRSETRARGRRACSSSGSHARSGAAQPDGGPRAGRRRAQARGRDGADPSEPLPLRVARAVPAARSTTWSGGCPSSSAISSSSSSCASSR